MLIPAPALSSLHSLSSHYFHLPTHFLPPGGVRPPLRRGDLAIRNGGGPRTYPGGVSKWQWKRMQAKKARQLLKARLARERQLYEMRKRTELRDAVAHLERPWDPDSAADASAVAPNLLSVAADDQLRALADRFHRPGGVDLWNDRDGPRVFASPATGATSARFFPKNAVHSVQPYALVGDGGDASAPRARGNAADQLLLGRGDGGAQGVRENASEDGAYRTGNDEPAVELMERDGTWEPVNALNNGEDTIADYWSSDDDSDVVRSESEDMGDAGPSRVPPAMMLRLNGRNNGVARWDVAGAMAASSNDDNRGWSGDAFFSDSERASEGRREQRWQKRSSGTSTRKRAGGRQNASTTAASRRFGQRGRPGAGSFSDSEVILGGPGPKWRPRTRDGDRNGAGRWNVSERDSIGEVLNSNSDNARGREMEPGRGARNKFNGREDFRGRSKSKYGANTSGGDVPGRHMRANNGDEHQSSRNGDRRFQFSGGFAEDLEAPTWKPRRTNRSRNNSGDGRDDSVSGRFSRGDNARRFQGSPRTINREDGRRIYRHGGQRFRGEDYSLRPTSELHAWRETGSDES